uniref:Uncharacterized protein n=1 Tax=Candidatus Kentrum sp. FW TaxID=2126338 RepID=A0A450TCX8_9GAMM|nr:MAG: hypothetical protein BECKFW1821A_GA0114235_11774 [Candidatus Kentron sp. FW]VFJ71976.1 MAG: hypothetical protein BECKFW1821B_GA0114236_12462 [Candidatus Kentron sp. FW]
MALWREWGVEIPQTPLPETYATLPGEYKRSGYRVLKSGIGIIDIHARAKLRLKTDEV